MYLFIKIVSYFSKILSKERSRPNISPQLILRLQSLLRHKILWVIFRFPTKIIFLTAIDDCSNYFPDWTNYFPWNIVIWLSLSRRTASGGMRRSSLPFLKVKKSPWFVAKCSFKTIKEEKSKVFLCGTFFSCVLDEILIDVILLQETSPVLSVKLLLCL